MLRLQSDDIIINCMINGPKRAPWITFVTGITNDMSMWETNVAALSQEYRLLRLDTRGHGQSGATAPPYTISQLATDVTNVWERFWIEHSHLVGIGLGGMTATAVALDSPDQVDSLIQVSCRTELTPEYSSIWPPMIEKSAEGGLEAIAEETMNRWFPERFRNQNPDVMEAVRTMILGTSLEGYHGCIHALQSLDFGDRLGELAMPVLCISGALDSVGAPSDVMEKMSQTVQNGRHASLPDAGHICSMANPREFERVVLEFLSSI